MQATDNLLTPDVCASGIPVVMSQYIPSGIIRTGLRNILVVSLHEQEIFLRMSV